MSRAHPQPPKCQPRDHDKSTFTALQTRRYVCTDRKDKIQGAVLLTVGRSYVGNDVARSTLLDRACVRVPSKTFLNIVPTALGTRPPDLFQILSSGPHASDCRLHRLKTGPTPRIPTYPTHSCYCKTLNVRVGFISRVSRQLENREI